MNGRSSSLSAWHMRNAARNIAIALAAKGPHKVQQDLAAIRATAKMMQANRKALNSGQPLPFPPAD